MPPSRLRCHGQRQMGWQLMATMLWAALDWPVTSFGAAANVLSHLQDPCHGKRHTDWKLMVAPSAVQGGIASASARSGADSASGGPLMYRLLGDVASSRRSAPVAHQQRLIRCFEARPAAASGSCEHRRTRTADDLSHCQIHRALYGPVWTVKQHMPCFCANFSGQGVSHLHLPELKQQQPRTCAGAGGNVQPKLPCL
jgi:hypothetical protein